MSTKIASPPTTQTLYQSGFGNQFTYGLPYSAQSTDNGELIVYALK